MDPYKNLATGIIVQAVENLKQTNKKIKICEEKIKEYESDLDRLEIENNNLLLLNGEKKALEKFFQSDWFEALCDLAGYNSEYLLGEIKKRNNNGK